MIPIVEIIAPACTGCGVCVESCPMDVLRMTPPEAGAPLPSVRYGGDCEGCLLCVIDCPREAVRVRMVELDAE